MPRLPQTPQDLARNHHGYPKIMGSRRLHTAGVAGSIPAAPTNQNQPLSRNLRRRRTGFSVPGGTILAEIGRKRTNDQGGCREAGFIPAPGISKNLVRGSRERPAPSTSTIPSVIAGCLAFWVLSVWGWLLIFESIPEPLR